MDLPSGNGVFQSCSRDESPVGSRHFAGMLFELAHVGCRAMKALLIPALLLMIAAFCLFEFALCRDSSFFREYEAAFLSLQWMLLICLVVWCGAFQFLTFSLNDSCLVCLLIIAIVGFFIGEAEHRPAIDAITLLFGVTLGRATRFILCGGSRRESAPIKNTITDQSRLTSAAAFLIGLTLLLAIASWWHLDMLGSYHGPRWAGLWNNPNDYGMLMGAGVALTTGLLAERLKAKGKKLKLILIILFIVAGMMGVGLVFSYSRGAWVGTAIGLLYLAKVYGKFKWRYILPPILLSVVVVCFFWKTPRTAPWYFQRLDLSRGSVQHRIAAWKAGLEIMTNHPLGVGWGEAVDVYAKQYSPSGRNVMAITTNDYLMLGMQLGILGLICFVTYVALSFRGGARHSVRAAIDGTGGQWTARPNLEQMASSPVTHHLSPEASLRVACRAGALVCLVAFWFDGGLFKLATASVFWILLELGAAKKISPYPPHPQPLSNPIREGSVPSFQERRGNVP